MKELSKIKYYQTLFTNSQNNSTRTWKQNQQIQIFPLINTDLDCPADTICRLNMFNLFFPTPLKQTLPPKTSIIIMFYYYVSNILMSQKR